MRTFNQHRITIIFVIFFCFYLFPRLMLSLYIYPCPSYIHVFIFYAFLRRRKKTVLLLRFVHDLAISAALLSLPYPLAILRLIDTADLFLRKYRLLLQLLVDKECVVKLLRLYLSLECVPIYSFTSRAEFRNNARLLFFFL